MLKRWVLDAVYARTPKQLAAALELLLAHESLVLQDADVVAAAVQQFRAKPALGFSDCLVLQIARKAGHLPLATFDKALAKQAGAQKL
jgi:predicted nucleic-acid-binding protein